MIQSKQTFHFKPPIQVKGVWTVGFTDLEVHNSFFNITDESTKFKLYKFPDEKSGGITYEKVIEMRLKETWIFQIFQLLIYKML